MKGVRIVLRGLTQGVGFRPAVFNLAARTGVHGYIINDSSGVEMEIEGDDAAVAAFLDGLDGAMPSLAVIDSRRVSGISPRGYTAFRIAESRRSDPGPPPIPPDISICPECTGELLDPGNRRYLYPFITCTACGPRYTITRRSPYDRVRTTMAPFTMCSLCEREYVSPEDRRFHSETNSCPSCGPELRMLNSRGECLAGAGEVIPLAVKMLMQGAVLAVKGVGGFHLAVDACNGEAVERLRKRKRRPDKPFALMAPDVETIAAICRVADEDVAWLTSPAHPIILMEKKVPPAIPLAPNVARRNRTLGVMLPYTPIHVLLFRHPGCETLPRILVMTSGNRSDEPIVTRNEDALDKLGDIADGIVVHDREILFPCDDSIIRASRHRFFVRRARGYVPRPLDARASGGAAGVLALGAELKNTICVLRGRRFFLSPHVGDLKSPETFRMFRAMVEKLLVELGMAPDVVACDSHPGYQNTRWAESRYMERLVRVQHHHAHGVSCMVEHELDGEYLAVTMDGSGWGPDGTVWGGEFLKITRQSFQRLGCLPPVSLPGGDAAVLDPQRMAFVYLGVSVGWPDAREWMMRAGTLAPDQWQMLRMMVEKGFNAPRTTSAGRLFDAAAFLSGAHRGHVSFEGQAAIALEACVDPLEKSAYAMPIFQKDGLWMPDTLAMIRALLEDRLAGVSTETIAARFHNSLAAVIAELAERLAAMHHLPGVVLSGGIFQNRILLENVVERLKKKKIPVYHHVTVPPNDAGISVGQAAIAREVYGCA